jgi:hypothetical protein
VPHVSGLGGGGGGDAPPRLNFSWVVAPCPTSAVPFPMVRAALSAYAFAPSTTMAEWSVAACARAAGTLPPKSASTDTTVGGSTAGGSEILIYVW